MTCVNVSLLVHGLSRIADAGEGIPEGIPSPDWLVLETIEQIGGDSGFADRAPGEVVFSAEIDQRLDALLVQLLTIDDLVTFRQMRNEATLRAISGEAREILTIVERDG
jgi:hypothetical protein